MVPLLKTKQRLYPGFRLMPLLVPKTWWHDQVLNSLKELPSSLFPHLIPAHPSHLPNTALQAPILALLIHTKNHIFHIHSVSQERQQTLYFLTEVLTCAMFTTKKALDKYLNCLKCFNFFWDISILNIRVLWFIFMFYCFRCFKLWEIFGKNKDNKIFTITSHKALHNNIQYTRI